MTTGAPVAATTARTTDQASLDALLATPLELHPQVALRPEPFGALAYHYGNRRLVFLKHRDMVTVARALADHPSLADALDRVRRRPGPLAQLRQGLRLPHLFGDRP
jgi:putative mycofactocin binding protein MftB